MTLISAMALGADCIEDCDVLRAGRTGQVLGHEVVAPSTLGTFLRAFSSATSASSTACWPTRSLAHGRLAPVTRADTGEVLHVRLRKGPANTSRGMLRFCDELIARVERAGATGPKLLRADSGFWSNKTFERLDRAGWQFSIGVPLQPGVRAAMGLSDEVCVWSR